MTPMSKFIVSTRQQPPDGRDEKTIYGVSTFAELAEELVRRLPIVGSPPAADKRSASSAGPREASASEPTSQLRGIFRGPAGGGT
jgi:hypothetical protein